MRKYIAEVGIRGGYCSVRADNPEMSMGGEQR